MKRGLEILPSNRRSYIAIVNYTPTKKDAVDYIPDLYSKLRIAY